MNRQSTRGVSLIEALVALLIMGFGMIGIVGVQTTLRMNADISKQRSEATRIAQEAIETSRAYSVIQSATGNVAYEDLVSTPAVAVTGYTTNTTFSRAITVSESAEPRMKIVAVDVSWTDRTNQAQTVRLLSQVNSTPPELAGTLAVAPSGLPTRYAKGRQPAIPAGAIDQGDGTSRFTPPGSSGVTWVFNNSTGLITCAGAGCTFTSSAMLVSGVVVFSIGAPPPPPPTQPTPAMAEIPTDPAFAVDVQVLRTEPAPLTADCYEQLTAQYVQYYCAVPLEGASSWSGRSELAFTGLATTLSDVAAAHFKVCRHLYP